MPDILAHYAINYLVASRTVKSRYALIIALIGLLSDLDVLLRIHRWVTHSIIPVLIIGTVSSIILFYMNYTYLKYLLLALGLYLSLIHI